MYKDITLPTNSLFLELQNAEIKTYNNFIVLLEADVNAFTFQDTTSQGTYLPLHPTRVRTIMNIIHYHNILIDSGDPANMTKASDLLLWYNM